MLDQQLHFACNVSTLERGASRGFEVAVGEGVLSGFIVRNKGGQLKAYQNSCPHTGAPLNWTPDQFLTSSGQYIQCSLHGARFTMDDGECFSGPCAGKFLTPLRLVEKNGAAFIEGC